MLAYPALVYFALRLTSPRVVGLGILGIFALRLAIAAPRRLVSYVRVAGPIAAAVVAVSVASLVWNDPRALLLTPTLVNLALLVAFASSFSKRETLIETLALAQAGTLSAEEHRYCRRLTAVWCAFFLGNAVVSTGLALGSAREVWALYTGLVAYVLMGLLFAAEFIYRHWRFRRYVGLPTDALLQRIFPPDDLR